MRSVRKSCELGAHELGAFVRASLGAFARTSVRAYERMSLARLFRVKMVCCVPISLRTEFSSTIEMFYVQ